MIPLGPRQKAVAECLVNGMDHKQIEKRLHMAARTVKARINGIASKLGIPENRHPRVWIATQLHEKRAEYGIKCWACDMES